MRKAVVATVGEVANYCYKIPAEQGGGWEVLLQFVNACTTVRASTRSSESTKILFRRTLCAPRPTSQ